MAEHQLTEEYVRRVAHLSRLALSDAEVAALRGEVSGVLGLFERLRGLDVSGVEGLPRDGVVDRSALADDVPGPVLGVDVLMRMAPDAQPPFIGVPKVLGDGGGA